MANCDIVMKGGITSGVVYPPAIVELSKEYQFKNVGGASAGAIAAAATAAAEYGRQTGRGTSFKGIDALGRDLASPGFLLQLFTPDKSTEQMFRVIVGVLSRTSIFGKVLAGVFGLLGRFLFPTLAGVTVSGIIAWACAWLGGFQGLTAQQMTVLSAITVLWIVGATLVTVVAWSIIKTARALARNGYGFCSGAKTVDSLTPWMTDTFNKLAGLPNTTPLTFGHLWAAGQHAAGERGINLEVVTTNLTHLRPYTFPLDTDTFYFDPSEWAALFPAEVCNWLHAHPGKAEVAVTPSGKSLVPLPDAEDLPIVVAARLSLSFPALVSAVPLYAVDFSRPRNQGKPSVLEAERCWFSDGGICSNFPVHFFDSPIPRWPTFAITLKQVHPDYDKPGSGSDFVYLPKSNRGGILASWHRFNPTGKGLNDLVGFVGAILSTLLDWRDNLESRMPGYRNRIAHISLKPGEGGLNVTMPPALVKELAGRGTTAGKKLVTQFNFPQHVWARYRTTMNVVAEYLTDFAEDYATPSPDAPQIWDIIQGKSSQAPPGYDWNSAADRNDAVNETRDLASLAAGLAKDNPFGGPTAPDPKPVLRPRPRF